MDNLKAEMEAKQSLIKTKNAIRKKYQELHDEKLTLEEKSSKKYKPIIEPLKKFININSNKDVKKKEFGQIKFEPLGTPAPTIIKRDNTVFKTAIPPYRRNLFPIGSNSQNSASISTASAAAASQSANISGVHDMESSMDVVNDDNNVTSNDNENENNYDDDPAADELENKIQNEAKQISSAKKDNIYGIRTQHGEMYMGKEPVRVKQVNSQMKYCIRKKQFPLTRGLTDLLLMNNPKYYTEKDLQTYKEMLQVTSAHKVHYKPSGSIRRNYNSPKYKNIISNLFPQRRVSPKKGTEGEGIQLLTPRQQRQHQKQLLLTQRHYKTFNKSGTFNYTYWDDPNELVDRLRLLVSSQAAGHTGHNNEIISIIEELREAKLIV